MKASSVVRPPRSARVLNGKTSPNHPPEDGVRGANSVDLLHLQKTPIVESSRSFTSVKHKPQQQHGDKDENETGDEVASPSQLPLDAFLWQLDEVTDFASAAAGLAYSEGYVSVVRADSTVCVLLCGSTTRSWLDLEYQYDDQRPARQWKIDKWYLTERPAEDDGSVLLERGLLKCWPFVAGDGITYARLDFADNGYTALVPISSIFQINNYDDVAAVPPQATPFAVVGVTGENASRDQLQMLEARWTRRRIMLATVGRVHHNGSSLQQVIACGHNGEVMCLEQVDAG